MMYLFILLPKNLYIICKFAKIDYVELNLGKSHTNNKTLKLFSRAENDTTREYLE